MQNEFSKIVPLTQGRLPQTVELRATPEQRDALARRFGIIAVNDLQAVVTVAARANAGEYEVKGWLRAEVVQECVVTFEPVVERVESDVHRLFGPPPPATTEIDLDPLADEPEPFAGAELDLGEITAEELALALDPYPHAVDAEAVMEDVVADDADSDGEAPRPQPFASLKARLTPMGDA